MSQLLRGKAVFLDRDGVICENRDDYVKSWEEFVWIPGAKEALSRLRSHGHIIVVITNQSAIGRKDLFLGILQMAFALPLLRFGQQMYGGQQQKNKNSLELPLVSDMNEFWKQVVKKHEESKI